jgi:Repeat of unknown function (DUF5648)
MIEERLRSVHDYAKAHGYFSGFPNFHEADYGQGLVYGCILIKAGVAVDMKAVSAADLGNPGTPEERMRVVHGYAVSNGYIGGFPNFHELDYGSVMGDHFYTTSGVERNNAISTYGYGDEGIACYVFDSVQQTTGLYRLLNSNNGDHFYTTSLSEHDDAISTYGYGDEGIAAMYLVPKLQEQYLCTVF